MKPKKKVRVYIQDGPTIEGILAARTRTEYVLWAPKVIDPQQEEPVEVSGHVEIPRERVLWFQIVG